MDKEVPPRIKEVFKEIRMLHGLTEAEEVLLIQLSMVIRMCGWSPKMTLKLMKVLTAMWEVVVDEMEEQYKKDK